MPFGRNLFFAYDQVFGIFTHFAVTRNDDFLVDCVLVVQKGHHMDDGLLVV